jgi:hypothetical protein
MRNIVNPKRVAQRCGIVNPTKVSLQETRDCLKTCKENCNYFRRLWQGHQRRHLENCLGVARRKGTEEMRRLKSKYWQSFDRKKTDPTGEGF